MIYVLAFLIAWFLSVLQASAMPYLHVLGVTPDFVLIFAACFAVIRSQDEALVVVPISGLMRDLATSDPIGTSLLGFAPLIVLAAAMRFRTMDSRFVPAIAVAAAGTICHAVISVLVLAVTGQQIDAGDAVIRVILPLAIVNPLFTAIVYLPVRWIPRAKRPRFSGRGPLMSPL